MVSLGKCEGVYRQKRVFNRVLARVMSELFAFGRHTITQLLLTLGVTEEDWSAWYRVFSQGRFREEETAEIMLEEMLSKVDEVEISLGLSLMGGHGILEVRRTYESASHLYEYKVASFLRNEGT